MNRKHELAKCEDCPLASESYVPSQSPTGGSERGVVVVVGEAPGQAEAKGGTPFTGPSGKLLDTVLRHNGIQRSDCFVTNVVLCHPPANRAPSKKEIDCCSERLHHEVLATNPVGILALGNSAAGAVMGSKTKITQLRAGPPKESGRFPGIPIVPSIHPAACLRATDSFPSLVADVAKLREVVNGATGNATAPTIRSKWEPPTFRTFDSPTQASQALRELSESRYPDLVVDIETAYDKDSSFEHPHHYRLLCVGLSYRRGAAIVIGETALQDADVRTLLARNLKERNLTAHNGKYDLQGLEQIQPGLKLHYDTMLASYIEDERQGTHGLKYLAVEILGAPQYDDEIKGFRTFADVPTDALYQYNAYDCACTWELMEYYQARQTEDGKRLNELLIRASNALVPIELDGIGVDLDYLQTLKKSYEDKMDQLETELSVWVGNPRSPMQVAAALRELGIPYVSTTDANYLESVVARPHVKPELKAFCQKMLEYRKEQKIYGTYVKGADKRLFEGRLYPTVLLHGTTTGRPSCRNPNLYNIPRGSGIRNLFVADPGNVFVQCDYSQIELRVVTCEAREPYFAEIFSDPDRDTHQEVADRLGITRQRAKMVVYGLNYEMSANGLAFRLGISLDEAARYVSEFHYVIPEIVKWKQTVIRKVTQEHDDLVTPYGRHRRFWLITRENREDVIKEAIAFYPQSIASDICLTAVCQLVEDGLKVRLSVYDSIMVECAESDAQEVARHMEKVMTESGLAYSDYVPFAVDTKIGRSWGDFG